ncbi:ABC transporter substrate-binding protein [Camelimonas abortus]|uniref:ABC transporter substrate-binding protein n=1 Tax=Camelimonas abortus TaxID=1017184 RepID=A0ABV7LFH9_9HYPH
MSEEDAVDRRQFLVTGAAAVAGAALARPAIAKGKKYDPGASDTEIRLGQTIPYSGAGSVYGAVGRAQAAYFEELNAKGGVNGRKIRFISLDDAYSAPKCVEATRRLVEQDEVLAFFGSLGTAPQVAVQKYLNGKGIPQLLLNTGAPRFNDPKQYPWTTPGLPLYSIEATILANFVAKELPGARVAVLSQNDEYGRDYLNYFKKALGDRGAVVAEATYDLTDATVDSQMLKLSQSGADVFYNCSSGKFTTQSIKKVHELNWKPKLNIIISTSAGSSIINPAGEEATRGLYCAQYVKNISEKRWQDDPAVKEWEAIRAKHLPNIDPDNNIAFLGYSVGVLMAGILEKCGDELTRENVLKHATNLAGQTAPALLPGITYGITPTDYSPFNAMIMGRYDGKSWELMGDPISR